MILPRAHRGWPARLALLLTLVLLAPLALGHTGIGSHL